jgi:hypothetical protein
MNPEPVHHSANELELTVVREPTKPIKTGRPLRLTKRKFVAICHHIESGLAVTTSCELESVTYQIFRFRISHSARLEQRFKQAETVRSALRRERALAAINKAGESSWMAFAWYLERTEPNSFSLRNKIERELVQLADVPVQTRVCMLPSQEFDEIKADPSVKLIDDNRLERFIGGVKVAYVRLAR